MHVSALAPTPQTIFIFVWAESIIGRLHFITIQHLILSITILTYFGDIFKQASTIRGTYSGIIAMVRQYSLSSGESNISLNNSDICVLQCYGNSSVNIL